MPRNADTQLLGDPGKYSLRFYERRTVSIFGKSLLPDYRKLGHATLGGFIGTGSNATVTRKIDSVQNGDVSKAVGGWISGWLGTLPEDFSPTIQTIEIESSDEWLLPCWLQMNQPAHGTGAGVWVIHVHGRGASPAETARNFKHFAALGFNNLAVTYRNDGHAKLRGVTKRQALGLGTTEWVDLESAVAYAKFHGANKILVFAWSYGAAISTQFARHSKLAHVVSAYIFDSPLISWRATLRFQVKLASAPESWAELGESFLRNNKSASSIGLAKAIDFGDFEIETLAKHFAAPTLLLHSVDDGYIPIEPCRELSDALPDTVTLKEFQQARHCKIYNFNQVEYFEAIDLFLGARF